MPPSTWACVVTVDADASSYQLGPPHDAPSTPLRAASQDGGTRAPPARTSGVRALGSSSTTTVQDRLWGDFGPDGIGSSAPDSMSNDRVAFGCSSPYPTPQFESLAFGSICTFNCLLNTPKPLTVAIDQNFSGFEFHGDRLEICEHQGIVGTDAFQQNCGGVDSSPGGRDPSPPRDVSSVCYDTRCHCFDILLDWWWYTTGFFHSLENCDCFGQGMSGLSPLGFTSQTGISPFSMKRVSCWYSYRGLVKDISLTTIMKGYLHKRRKSRTALTRVILFSCTRIIWVTSISTALSMLAQAVDSVLWLAGICTQSILVPIDIRLRSHILIGVLLRNGRSAPRVDLILALIRALLISNILLLIVLQQPTLHDLMTGDTASQILTSISSVLVSHFMLNLQDAYKRSSEICVWYNSLCASQSIISSGLSFVPALGSIAAHIDDTVLETPVAEINDSSYVLAENTRWKVHVPEESCISHDVKHVDDLTHTPRDRLYVPLHYYAPRAEPGQVPPEVFVDVLYFEQRWEKTHRLGQRRRTFGAARGHTHGRTQTSSRMQEGFPRMTWEISDVVDDVTRLQNYPLPLITSDKAEGEGKAFNITSWVETGATYYSRGLTELT
ncbi:hypothetical protein DICSQDRAFT_128280 [Dichomitus squalens LYAD-421 SS1]|uniref:Uncharacterized protein n=1 Tax=Dichomitus squalens (strain LYAD-421) TaxID=732165 RepID=R7SUH3_DICSQ|nr:uncharacterized protein DICSQDRAFT_128280 [Dichomitus squalens LYAD-421 SS1]EJF59415.1 hypothetical protein DICSQDRAFT_128280 [Dichomitus squalens LYAD-421 SS1]